MDECRHRTYEWGQLRPSGGCQSAEEREGLWPRGVLSFPLSVGERIPPTEVTGARDGVFTRRLSCEGELGVALESLQGKGDLM